MKHQDLRLGPGFRVGIGNRRSQAAVMTIAPGQSEGSPVNAHRGSDQWLYVVSGTGMAYVDENAQPLKARSLLLIERGQKHEIRNTVEDPYAPLTSMFLRPIVPMAAPSRAAALRASCAAASESGPTGVDYSQSERVIRDAMAGLHENTSEIRFVELPVIQPLPPCRHEP